MTKEIFGFWFRLICLVILAASLSGCEKENKTTQPAPSGKIIFQIDHRVNGEPLKENEMIYTNAAGNNFLITEVKYFISDIAFYRDDGTVIMVEDWEDIFYVDADMLETQTIHFYDDISAGAYDSISFTFGISEEKNESFMFVNPPEVNMFWPEILGGGYHYMMINGKWKDAAGSVMPFDFHLGIGQLYHGTGNDVDSIFAFVQNYFRISMPGSSFILTDNDTVVFRLTMHIESWFETPHIFDFDVWGGAIMQNQQAMQIAKENGRDVFSIQKE